MKQKLYLFTLVLLSQMLSYGQNFTSGGINYVVTSATAPYTVAVGTHVAADGLPLTITIPETVENSGLTYAVTSIGDLAFKEISLVSVSMGNSITSIGNSAFFYSVHLNSIILSNSLTTIGQTAFVNCVSLTSITLPNSLVTIGDGAFLNCSALTSITIPNAVTTIGAYAFQSCAALTSIVLPTAVTSIGAEAFSGCLTLTSIILPNSITTIEDYTFRNCSALTSVTIPNSITSIGQFAFFNCTSLTSIAIPNSVTFIRESAFNNCGALTSINIPNSVTSIGSSAFQFCVSLTSVTVNWTTPLAINTRVFRSVPISTVTLNIPNGTIAAYQAAPIWQNFNIATPPATHLNFDGVDDYVSLPNETSFDFTNQMTVEFWMNSNVTPQQWDGLVTKGDDSWRVALTSTGTVAFAGTGAFSDFYSNTSVTDGSWHHVAVTYNGANAIIYIDGVQESSLPATGNIDNSSFAVAIGENLLQTGRLYAGNMDEVRIWNIARTASQINESKNCELQGNETGLVSYYKFNQGNSGANNSGQPSLLDSSASGNNGTFTGFALTGTSSNFLEGSVVTTGSTIPAAPAAAAQTFILTGTAADLVPAPSATMLWYNVATGGTALAANAALATGTYYVSSMNSNGCESERTAVSVTINLLPEAPTTTFSTQIFAGDDKTVADLQVTGNTIIWYDVAIAGAVLPTTTLLVDETTYYASQTIDGLESDNRVAITVNRISEASQTLATGSTVADLVATPSTGTSVQWFASSTSADALDNAVTLATGTYFVEQVTPNLNVSTLTGTTQGFSDGDPSIAKFNQPYNMDFDADGNMYVADYINNRIRKVTPLGVVSTLAGATANGFADGNGANAFFHRPTDLVVDKVAGLIYVTDANNNAIRIVSFAGDVTTLTAGLGSGFADGNLSNAQFHYPSGIVRDLAGNLYISDQNNNRIRKITVAGNVSTLAGNGDGTSVDGTGIGASLYGPAGIDFDSEGNLYVIEYDGFNLRKITTAGVVTTVVTGAAAGFLYPNGLVVDSQNNILIADTDNSLIKKVTPDGTVSVFAGSSFGFSDGPALSAAFKNPIGIAINTLGEIFVADAGDHKIRKITSDAIATNRVAVAVVIEDALSLTAASQTNVSCNGTATGSATVNEPTNGTAPYTYDWTGNPIGDGTTTISQLSAGVYVCTVTDAAGNTAMQSFTITQPFSLVAFGNVYQPISCFGGDDGGVSIQADGGVAPYTYQWSSGQTTAIVPTGLAAGVYQGTVTDANGCSEQINVLLQNPALYVATGVVNNHVSCFGGSNAVATVNINVNESLATFLWSNGQTSKTISGLTAGNYSVNVTFNGGCVITTSVIITQPALLQITPASQTNIACFGSATGSITLNPATGGTAPYSYDWTGNPTGDGTTTISGLTVGTYSCTVTDAKGCTVSSQTFGITQPVQLTVPTAAANQTLCSGLSVADLEPYANATIKWFAEANATTPLNNATLLVSGTTYYVASTNANGCQSNKVASTVTLTAAPPTPTIAGVTTQDFADIIITATSPCEEGGGLYLYKGTSNGKNKYESAFNSAAKLAYNAITSKWQLYVNSIDNVLFENSTANDDLFPPATGWVGQSFCNGSMLTIDTVTYTQNACEGSNASVLNPAPSSSINWYSNGGWPVFANDALVTGLYYVAFVNSEGCESPRTAVAVTVSAPNTTGSVTTSICAGQSYTWPANGQTYTTAQSGVTVVNGCSTATLNLTITTGTTWYADADLDGFGNPAVTQTSCDQPSGYVSNSLDCNDAVFAINPAATEICWNNIDDNCNSIKSEGCIAIPVFVNNPVTITNFSTHLSAIPYTYPGATSLDYRFEVTNISVTPNQTVTFTQSGVFARFFTIPEAIRGFNTTYTIRASAVINGEEVPYAVPVITAISTGIPTITLAPTSCGAMLSRLNATISANPGFNATSYEFRIRLTSDNGAPPSYYYFQSPSRFIGANSFGLSLQYNTSYSVSVRYSTPSVGAAASSVWSAYGAECLIETSRVPLISLSAFSCGSTLDRVGATISANPAVDAVQYQFRVRLTSDNGMPPTFYTTVASASRFSSLTAAQNLVVANGTQYSVSVSYSISLNGAAPTFTEYGPECIITTPGAAPVPRIQAAVFKVVAYPNPFSEGFQLNVTTPNTGTVFVKTYDMLGRLIEERSSKVSKLESISIGANYPSGVYNVIVSQDDEIRTVRVVKR